MRRGAAALAVTAALLLSGCSGATPGDAQPSGDPTGTAATASASPEPLTSGGLPVPEGVVPTPEGAALSLGETATVAWEPRVGTIGVVEITVEAIGRARIEDFAGWKLDKAARKSRPYYVISTFRNVGETELGGHAVPLFAGTPRGVLLQASEFREATFAACASQPFPEEFAPGEEHTICQVYLVPGGGKLRNLTFRPTEQFAPIEWSGPTPAWAKVPKKVKKSVGSQLRAKERAAKKAERAAKKAERERKKAERERRQTERERGAVEPD